MDIRVNLGDHSYDIIFEHGSLNKCASLINLNRKVFIVTDSGVPEIYAKTVNAQCKNGYVYTVPQGEGSKSIEVFKELLSKMLELGFGRKDCVVAVGGGVVGDLAGFTAASFMRGIDFYNIPTTVLSQVDSSIGGKTAVNLNGIKNIVGAFYQPKRVIIDPEVLNTLPERQISNGLAEAVKMSLTSDKELFDIFENEDHREKLDEIIYKSILIKKSVVEQDEKEKGLRRILNFGHTIGHAIESEEELNGLYHGECVALGMLPMCGKELRARLVNVLNKLNLKSSLDFNEESAFLALTHDKKGEGSSVKVTKVLTPGEFISEEMTFEEFRALLKIIKR
ncbi:MAG: 3-dehydroquinate synthase [Oscillospiraceae bacterium]|nr:3-dehydroquinate synthase [Oscillospiraceae bacterium]